jgi:hypothetical protein
MPKPETSLLFCQFPGMQNKWSPLPWGPRKLQIPVRRNLEAKGLELTELEFTLREVELNSDRLQQYLEQSQSNLEMQTEEKLGSQQTSVSPVWERELVQEVLIRLWRIFSWI